MYSSLDHFSITSILRCYLCVINSTRNNDTSFLRKSGCSLMLPQSSISKTEYGDKGYKCKLLKLFLYQIEFNSRSSNLKDVIVL